MDDDVRRELAPTGVLRASINLGNSVLAQGSPSQPSGVSVDLALELGRRLDVPVDVLCFDAARKSLAAVVDGAADLCFLAIDPARAEVLAFTAAYALIEGVFAVPRDSSIRTLGDVDRPGIRIGVKQGSAYDLFLSREYRRAEVVRGEEGTQAFQDLGLEVAAGIRQPITAFVAADPTLRIIEPPFMQIEQAIAIPVGRPVSALRYLRDFVEDVKASGFVAESLLRSGQDIEVAPAADG
ncbi:amino acid ABC transporter substrate-binding protein, PAAT family [Raineyella antarctica]|uniref:Amino acid ABC transporter substrate-binding protein, PAAT family n=1 Tax=Raineyella antarctica TaxID=1577474 RepID=A0A1G6GDT3_9ACTN|nr:transporter substrate-binding domain-containing protein [Raineyella antarctica]SDB79993.1 amino acid ABC transporter substrate-binding protein, PAAT family [Raineyella antarctica]